MTVDELVQSEMGRIAADGQKFQDLLAANQARIGEAQQQFLERTKGPVFPPEVAVKFAELTKLLAVNPQMVGPVLEKAKAMKADLDTAVQKILYPATPAPTVNP